VRRSARSLFLGLIVALLAAGARAQPPSPSKAAPGKERPNLIVVLLDDADADILETMPRLRTLVGDRGARFTANVANTPLCGPARAVILTGQYAHRTKVYYNNGPEGGYTPWLAGGYDAKNLGPWLQDLGYRTGIFGKYLNDFPSGRAETFVPPGWDDFRGVLSDREAHNNRFTLNENGALTVYDAATGGYQTDLLSGKLDAFIRASEARDDQPFFALLSLSAPHVPPEPAERHKDAFPGDVAPRKPSYDEADLKDKPKALQEQAKPLTPADHREIDATYRAMRQSLLAVEDAIESLTQDARRDFGERSKTYIFLTSDNGWMRGEHRIPSEKYAPYEESIRVPLIVTGPGRARGPCRLPPHRTRGSGTHAPRPRGGVRVGDPGVRRAFSRAFLRAVKPETTPWRESILIEHFGGGSPFRVRSYVGARTEKDVYIEYATGEKEYYDLVADPFQMENRASSLAPAVLARLSARLAALRNCAAAACRAAESAPAPPAKRR
jgi:N-acetylglucosamine-6-sulfatase